MPRQFFNDKIVLENGRNRFMGRSNDDTIDVDLFGINPKNELEFRRAPKHNVYDFTRMPAPLAGKKGATGGPPTGAEGDENILIFPDLTLEYHVFELQSTVAPTMTAGGLDLNSLDQDADDGVEYTTGMIDSAPHVYTIGADPSFYSSVTFSITDASGIDLMGFGLRRVEDYQLQFPSYFEYAALEVDTSNMRLSTRSNGGLLDIVDTTLNWADGEVHTYRMEVSSSGLATFSIDGNIPPVTISDFAFSTGSKVVPFFHLLNTGPGAGSMILQKWEMGHL